MAGIAAAESLQSRGYRVIVLEARDRIGGRVWTDRSWPNVPVDLGASWVNGTARNPIARLARRYELRTCLTEYDSLPHIYAADGRELSEAECAALKRTTDRLLEEVGWMSEELDEDIGLGAAIDLVLDDQEASPAERQKCRHLVHTMIEQEYAADLDDLSVWYWDDVEEFYGAHVLFPEGYDRVVEKLAAKLDIRIQHEVRRINYRRKRKVRIETTRAAFEADRVVVTVPLGVLKSGSISFSPALPARKREAIVKLAMGVLDKLCLQFPHAFWPDDRDWFEHMGDPVGLWAEFFNLHRYTRQPVLVGFNAGSQALRLESLSDRQIVSDAMRALRTMFGDAIPDPVRWVATRWGADRFARGSYCHVPPGASGEDIDALAEPVSDRLLFAGEATHRGHYGTVHGAYLSGVRAAALIAEPARWRRGDRVRLTVREPKRKSDARATKPANYRPVDYVARVEQASFVGGNACLTVRWHAPLGAETSREGTVSTLVHIANGVWLEARRRPRNATVTLERISCEEYESLLKEAYNE